MPDIAPCWEVFREHGECDLGFLPGDTGWVSDYTVQKHVPP